MLKFICKISDPWEDIMKLRKFFIICAVIFALTAMLAISVSAQELQLTRDQIESLTADLVGGGQRGDVEHIFDGDLRSADPWWYPPNGWAGVTGSSVTVVFVDEIEITSVLFYGWSNYNAYSVTFYDEAGIETAKHYDKAYEIMDGSPSDLEIRGIRAKTMVIKTESAKGVGNMTFTEFIIKYNHEHKFVNFESMIVPPTCALEGVAEYSCSCGEKQNGPYEATGEHTEETFVAYRNGFTNTGYQIIGCPTCDTRDNVIGEVGALFTPLGYSVSETGANGIHYGFAVNYDNLDRFEELAGYGIDFGIVAYSLNAYDGETPLLATSTGVAPYANGVICKTMTFNGYDVISYKISGFSDDYKDSMFVLCGYIFDGESFYFLGDESSKEVTPVSFNGILESARS